MTTGIVLAALVGIVVLLLHEWRHDREAWAEERALLLQRIQAPERAVAAEARRAEPAERPRPKAIALDDDDAMLGALGQEVNTDGDS